MSRHPDDIRRTHYEWAIETVYWDEDEGMQDIEDSNYWDKLSDYQPGEVADALAQKRFVREDGIEVMVSPIKERSSSSRGSSTQRHTPPTPRRLNRRASGAAPRLWLS